MKSCDKIAQEVIERRNSYVKCRKKRIKKTLYALCCTVIVAVGVFTAYKLSEGAAEIFSSQSETNTEEITEKITEKITENITEKATRETAISDPTRASEPDIEWSGGWFIPALPTDREIRAVGEEITDDEAESYFSDNEDIIKYALSSSGVKGELTISKKGYCHVTYDGTEGKSFEVRQNFRDYMVFSGERVVAIITLYKEDGKLYDTPSFGAPWFDNLTSYLKEHKGEELVFVYASFYEMIIAPDNSYINPMGHDATRYIGNLKNPYETFYHPSATYTP